ncbi:MAG: Crp/Fnr family transcriptional regulator [Acidobacteria bacterium]|nr:Crp/Fnr family transcriptional regulator [Acidobacteriota bacterium]
MSVVAAPNLLGEIALFRGLPEAELSKLGGLFHRRTLPAGATFITAEQPGEAVYVIADGAVKVFIDDPNGNEVILTILVGGEIVGEMSLLDCAGRSANVVTLEETVVYWMDRTSFGELLRTIPTIHFNLSRLLCDRLRVANARIQSLALQDVEGRVAHQLLTFADVYGKKLADGKILIPFRLTQSDLASLIGATRVRVNQVIATYKQRHFISVENYRITVHNRDALDRRSRCSTGNWNKPPERKESGISALMFNQTCSQFNSRDVVN